MRTRFFRLGAVLVVVMCVSATLPQFAFAARHKGIDPALLAKANAGDAEAQYQLGNAYNYGDKVRRDYAQALIWYRKSAEQGNPDSEFQLGGLYHFGHGVPKDDVQTFAWTKKAAEQEDAVAENFLSVCYMQGWGVPKDQGHEIFWLHRAADDGYGGSQYFLGLAFEYGLNGVPQDFASAYYWLDLAAQESDSRKDRKDAGKVRDKAASHLKPAELSREQERVRAWLEQHPANAQ